MTNCEPYEFRFFFFLAPPGVTRRTVRDESAIQPEIGKDFPPCPGWSLSFSVCVL